jgi:hypothetical protein
MEKEFNVTGSCNPQKHYMADISHKFDEVMKLIEKGKYFTINRPRQYGKTTMLNMLAQHLWKQPDKYILARLSFEGLDDCNFESSERFCPEFVKRFIKSLKQFYPEIAKTAEEFSKKVSNMDSLSEFITQFVTQNKLDVVMLIDEVDKSSNNQLFLSFIGMLRNKYLDNEAGADETFQSVVLAGVHDVKSLKLKIREGDETKLNSPWNIAADFNVDMSFNPAEIKTMLVSYAEDKSVKMDFEALAERIHYYTSGYPFLVSKICKNIDEEEAGQNPDYNPTHWTLDDIDWSFRWLTRPTYATTNFEDLAKNLENNQDLYELVYKIIFATEPEGISFSRLNPVVNLGIMYGIFKESSEKIEIHNRIYEQILYDYMRSKKETSSSKYSFNGYVQKYESSVGLLELSKAMLKFQEFMKEHYSDKDTAFLEREGRLVFMSFLKPIVNGKGFMWKEPVVGDERRMDIVVTYGKEQKEVIELKIWRGEEYHQEGLKQLSDYLDFQGIKNGYLLIYDFRKEKGYKSEQIRFEDKEIFAVWV